MFRCYNLHLLLLFIVCLCSPKFRRMQLFLWNLLGLVQDLPTDFNTHRCSSPLSKMAWYLFISYGINIYSRSLTVLDFPLVCQIREQSSKRIFILAHFQFRVLWFLSWTHVQKGRTSLYRIEYVVESIVMAHRRQVGGGKQRIGCVWKPGKQQFQEFNLSEPLLC